MGDSDPKMEVPTRVFEEVEISDEQRRAAQQEEKARRQKVTAEILRLKQEGELSDSAAIADAMDHDMIAKRSEELLNYWTEDEDAPVELTEDDLEEVGEISAVTTDQEDRITTVPSMPAVPERRGDGPPQPAVEGGQLVKTEELSKEEIERLKTVEQSAEKLLIKLEQGGLDSFDKQSLQLLNKVLSDENKGGALMVVRKKLTGIGQFAAEKGGDSAAGWYLGVPAGGEMGRKWANNKMAEWIQKQIALDSGSMLGKSLEFAKDLPGLGSIVEKMASKAGEGVAAATGKAAEMAGGVGKAAGGVIGFMSAGALFGGITGFIKEWRAARGFGRVKKLMEKARLFAEQEEGKEEYKEKKKAEAAGEKSEDGWVKRKAKDVGEALKTAYKEETKAQELREMRSEVEQGRDPRLELLAMQKALLESPDELSIDLDNDEWVKFVGAARDAKVSLIRERMKIPDGGMLSEQTIAEMEGNAELVETFLENQDALAQADLQAAVALLAKFEADVQEDIDVAGTELEDYSTKMSKLRRYGGSIVGGAWRGTHIPAAIKTIRILAKAGFFVVSGGTSALSKVV